MKLIITGLLFLSLTCNAQVHHKEVWYQVRLAKITGGIREVPLPDGSRCDLVWGDYAIEINPGENWYNAVGQSLYYAINLNKAPGIIVIIETEKEMRFVPRLASVAQRAGIKLWMIKSDTSFYSVNVHQSWDLKQIK